MVSQVVGERLKLKAARSGLDVDVWLRPVAVQDLGLVGTSLVQRVRDRFHRLSVRDERCQEQELQDLPQLQSRYFIAEWMSLVQLRCREICSAPDLSQEVRVCAEIGVGYRTGLNHAQTLVHFLPALANLTSTVLTDIAGALGSAATRCEA